MQERSWVGAMALLLCSAFATCEAHSVFSINEPWARLTANGRSAEVYMRITSSDGARLVSVSSPAAERTAIHPPGQGARAVSDVVLPAKQVVTFARGQYRIQLTGLARKPKLGDHLPLTIGVRGEQGDVQEIPLQAEVRLHSPTEDEGGAGHAHSHTPSHAN
jgi:copper(I)-binding protein